MKRLITICVERPVFATMIVLSLVVVGAVVLVGAAVGIALASVAMAVGVDPVAGICWLLAAGAQADTRIARIIRRLNTVKRFTLFLLWLGS